MPSFHGARCLHRLQSKKSVSQVWERIGRVELHTVSDAYLNQEGPREAESA
jgi:hypothetical protein